MGGGEHIGLQEPVNSNKRCIIHITRVPERKEKEWLWAERGYEEIMDENFPKFGTNTQTYKIQKGEQTQKE